MFSQVLLFSTKLYIFVYSNFIALYYTCHFTLFPLHFFFHFLSFSFNLLQVTNANDKKHKLSAESWYKWQTSYWLQWVLPLLMPGLNLVYKLRNWGSRGRILALLWSSLPCFYFAHFSHYISFFFPVCCKSRELSPTPCIWRAELLQILEKNLSFSEVQSTTLI